MGMRLDHSANIGGYMKILNKFISIAASACLAVSCMAFPAVGLYADEGIYSAKIPEDLKVEIGAGGGIAAGNWWVYKPASVTGISNINVAEPKLLVTKYGASWDISDDRVNNRIYVGKIKNTANTHYYTKKSQNPELYWSIGAVTRFNAQNKYIDEGDDFASAICVFKIDYTNGGPVWGGYNAGGVGAQNSGYSYNSYANQQNMDISKFSDNGYMIAGVYIEENVDMDSTYIAVASRCVRTSSGSLGTRTDRNVVGVPLSRYFTEDDRCRYIEAVIPLSDFDVSNDWVYAPYVDNNSALSKDDFDEKVAVNWQEFLGMGFIKRATDIADSDENFSVFCPKMQIGYVPAPEASITQTQSGKAITWAPVSGQFVSGYQIMETNDGGTTVHFASADELATYGGKLIYPISETMDANARYRVRAVTGSSSEVRGTAYSAFSEAAPGDVHTAVAESMDAALSGGYIDFSGFNSDRNLCRAEDGTAVFDIAPGDESDIGMAGLSFGRLYNKSNSLGYCSDVSDARDGYAVFSFKTAGGSVPQSLMLAIGSCEPNATGKNIPYSIAAVRAADYDCSLSDGGFMQYVIPMSDFSKQESKKFGYINGSNEYSDSGEFDISKFAFMGFALSGESDTITADKMIIGKKVSEPSNFNIADATPDSVLIEWDAPDTTVKSYEIYLNDSDEPIAVLGGDESSFTDTNGGSGFEPDTDYNYVIVANSEFGIRIKSDVIKVNVSTIDMPRSLTASTQYGTQKSPVINLSWSKPSYGDIAGYEVYRDGVLYGEINDGDTAVYTDNNPTDKKTHSYTMRAFGTENGEKIYSLFTAPVTATAVCLLAPEGFGASVNKVHGTVTLSWQSVEYADSYNVKINGDIIANVKSPALQYIIENPALNTYFGVSVEAVNAGGATSFENTKEKVYVRDPMLDDSETVIYDDSLHNDYSISASDKVTTDLYDSNAVSGSVSAKFDYTFGNLQNSLVSFNGALKADTLRKNGSCLTFQLKMADGDFAKNAYVSLTSRSLTPTNGYVNIRSSVRLADYAAQTADWQYVSIPFADFPTVGKGMQYMKDVFGNMNFAEVSAINIECENTSRINGVINIDALSIRKYRDWNIADILRDSLGNEIDKSAAGQLKSIRILFDMPMDAKSLNTSGVTLADSQAGKVVSARGEYNADENTYTMYLCEPLAPQTGYTLSINAKSASSDNLQTKTVQITTADFEPYGTDAQPIDIKCTIGTSGNKITVSLNKEDWMSFGKYSINIKYDSAYISPSANSAQYTVSGDTVKFSGDASANGENALVFEIPYTAKASGKTALTVSGSAEITNCAEAALSGNGEISVETSGSTGGTGSSGSSGSGSGKDSPADRSHGTGSAGSTGGNGGTFTPSTPGGNAIFSDISQVAWAKDSIEKLAKNDIINGYEDNTFRPQNIIRREEFAKMILLTCQIDESDDESGFADVAPGAWYAPYIFAAAQKGIIDGIGSGLFGVGSAITREDMCVMIDRAISALRLDVQYVYDDVDFADFDSVSDYAKPSVRKMYRMGIVNGSGGSFNPKGQVTRAMAAKVLGMLFDICR